ncbi:site-specific DNA-methyltransferase [Pasteurellaceae bacterium HPA106]|uniref:site-specific DNA-methyltransferase n=1 Tax=Spirabiliibacterium pneumoniae TaxID=221400 RepID=UPI002E2B548A|nr:site-specific DNA-methyltransferase [Spirabiliibacterium pneumoniae]MBE2895652.1 site-specific DNA-methyltransferase [Spirabiliibacterium pneumoniae]
MNAIQGSDRIGSATAYTQKTRKRQEIFFNRILAFDELDRLFDRKSLAHFTRYTADGAQPIDSLKRHNDGTLAENLIIKGNNLIALHSLHTQFKGKVKLIYIDVPFNTENDSFVYNDNFSRSTWLTFMKNRIEVAKELLSDDGMIFVHCDYNEDGYLRVLLDEIFTENNFVSNIAVRSSTPSGTKTAHKDKKIIKQKDTILFYKKQNIKLKPQYTARKNWDSHYSVFLYKEDGLYKYKNIIDEFNKNGFSFNRLDEIDPRNEKIRQFISENRNNIGRWQSHKNKEIETLSRKTYKNKIYEHFINNKSCGIYLNGQVFTPISQGLKEIMVSKNLKEYWSILVCDFWEDIDFQNTQNEGGVSFPTGKKPEALLYRIIDMCTQPGDIVLDFHLGSGTTAAVAHKMGRQYIGVEQMDYIETIAVERLKKVIAGEQGGISKAVGWQGGGEFVYAELAPFNETARQQILACKNFDELSAFFNTLCQHYFLDHHVSVAQFIQLMTENDFQQLSLDEQKQMMIDMLDLNQLYISLSDQDDSQFDDCLSDEDKRLSLAFYGEKS